MASRSARLPSGASAAYAAAKAGVVMLTRQGATETGPHGVRVNCVSPAAILTDAARRNMPAEIQRQQAAEFPMGRLGLPRDVGLATLFLASESSSWLTGVTLDIAGGRVML
jgi:3-oxoacyl-[acyl-carrier protein] reductase